MGKAEGEKTEKREVGSLQATAVSPFRAQSLLHRPQQFVHFSFSLVSSTNEDSLNNISSHA